MSAKEAWAVLWDQTIFAGDDSVMPAIPGLAASFEDTTSALGMKAKMDTSEPGEAVGFCGRIFVNPGVTLDSFQDPERTIIKLHLSGNKQVSPVQAAYNKARGYLATDSMTPIIGDWAKKVIDLCAGSEIKNALGEELYKMEHPWPQENAEMIREAFCNHFGWSDAELILKEVMIQSVTGLLEFPVILDNQLTHKIEAVIGDSVIGPKQPSDNNDAQQERGEPAANPPQQPAGSAAAGNRVFTLGKTSQGSHRQIGGRPGYQSGPFRGPRRGNFPTAYRGNQNSYGRFKGPRDDGRSWVHQQNRGLAGSPDQLGTRSSAASSGSRSVSDTDRSEIRNRNDA